MARRGDDWMRSLTPLLAAWVGYSGGWWGGALIWIMLLILWSELKGHPAEPLFRRFYLLRLPYFRVFLHQMHRHDDDRYVHNHPWHLCYSMILCGGYLEYRHPGTYHYYRRRNWNIIRAGQYHRIEDITPGTWTLFFAFGASRQWGFLTPSGHVNHVEGA